MALLQTDVAAHLTMVEKFVDKGGDFALSLIVAVIIMVMTLWAAGWASRHGRGSPRDSPCCCSSAG